MVDAINLTSPTGTAIATNAIAVMKKATRTTVTKNATTITTTKFNCEQQMPYNNAYGGDLYFKNTKIDPLSSLLGPPPQPILIQIFLPSSPLLPPPSLRRRRGWRRHHWPRSCVRSDCTIILWTPLVIVITIVEVVIVIQIWHPSWHWFSIGIWFPPSGLSYRPWRGSASTQSIPAATFTCG